MTEEDKIALLEKQQDYLAYDRYEYPMMARIFHNKNIKNVKIFGGFFNLYFYVPYEYLYLLQFYLRR